MARNLARRLEAALAALERDSSLVEALRTGLTLGHPTSGPRPEDWKYRAELEAALRTAQRLREGPHPVPRPEFRRAARERIVAAARASAQSRPSPTHVLVSRLRPFAAALVLALGCTAAFSFSASPALGAALSPARYAVEQIQLATAPDEASRARLGLTFAERRRAELASDLDAGRYERVADLAERYEHSLALARQRDVGVAEEIDKEAERGASAFTQAAESAPSPVAARLRQAAEQSRPRQVLEGARFTATPTVALATATVSRAKGEDQDDSRVESLTGEPSDRSARQQADEIERATQREVQRQLARATSKIPNRSDDKSDDVGSDVAASVFAKATDALGKLTFTPGAGAAAPAPTRTPAPSRETGQKDKADAVGASSARPAQPAAMPTPRALPTPRPVPSVARPKLTPPAPRLTLTPPATPTRGPVLPASRLRELTGQDD